MDRPLNLATLPPNIIRRIGHEAESVEPLRLISHSWNAVLLNYLSSPHLGSLERLHVSAGIPNEDIWEMRYTTEPTSNRVQMVAILPERYKERVGVGRWLSNFKKYTGPDAIEVNSASQHFQAKHSSTTAIKGISQQSRDDKSLRDLLFCNAIIAVINTFLVSLDHPGVGHYLLGMITVIVVFHVISECKEKKSGCRSPQEVQNEKLNDKMHAGRHSDLALRQDDGEMHFPQLARFVSMFARIETLVLEDIKGSCRFVKVDPTVFGALQTTLCDVQIDRLEVIERKVDNDLQMQIIDMCNAHRIPQVLIKAYTFSATNFREFAKQLIALDVQLDIYEQRGVNPLMYFGKSRLFWDRLVADLNEEKVSMRMLTSQDAAFNAADYQYSVSSHIRIDTASADTTQPLLPVGVKRGFLLRAF